MSWRKLTEEEKKQWAETQPCRNEAHKPPGMIVLPPGLHVWVCPGCGQESRVVIPQPGIL